MYHRLQSLVVLLLLALASYGQAHPDSLVEAPADRLVWLIDTADVGRLTLDVGSTVFFQDNEFSTPAIKGYTLPGFRLLPTVNYTPNRHVLIQGGVYLLRFWGTDSYPNMAYNDIGFWTGDENATKGFHVLPFLRVQFASSVGVNLVMGSIYGGHHHRLIEPLYASELNFTADPEAGVQVLYANRWLDWDMWVNWQSFIYKGDDHQESFVFGVSSRVRYNRESSPVHVYSPVQLLFHHRGGEIQVTPGEKVHTLVNGAAGVGAVYNVGRRGLRHVGLELDGLFYNQTTGQLWPYNNGWAYYINAYADVANVRAKAGYLGGHKFISLLGYPFYGSVSTSTEGLLFDTSSTAFVGGEYTLEVARGYTLGVDMMLYRHWPGEGRRDDVVRSFKPSNSFYGAVFVRVNPSFLLKDFNH